MAAVPASLCCTLLLVAFVFADQKTITAESGQTVTLPCRASSNDDPEAAVEWSRTDLETEYVLLYRDGHFDPVQQHPSFKDRVDLQDKQMNDGDVSLILKDVTTADSGTYECRIKGKGTSRGVLRSAPISTITLRVVGPPGQVIGGEEEDGSAGLIVGLSVSAGLLIVAAVGFLIYRKQMNKSQTSEMKPV